MQAALDPWLTDSNLQAEDYELQGDPVAKRYTVQIKGQKGYAARKVSQAIGALRIPWRGNGWRKFSAVPPTGGAEVDINVGVDKSPKTVARELGCKKIVRCLLQAFPNRKFFVDRDKGVVSSNWKDLVAFTPPPTGSAPTIQYCEAHLQEFQMDVREVRRMVGALFEDQRDTEWCL